MQRRNFTLASTSVIGSLILAIYQQAWALSVSDLAGISNKDASAGLKTALARGALAAVGLLGKTDGFLGNDKVRIPLPGFFQDAAGILKMLGQGKRIDELILSINLAAEAAVPMGRDFSGEQRTQHVGGGRQKHFDGGESWVTSSFAVKTRNSLSSTFLPIVTHATEKVGLANQYNELADTVASFGLVKKEDAKIQQYVTGKSLNGLHLIIGDEEKKIRQDPIGTGSAILQKVFGALK